MDKEIRDLSVYIYIENVIKDMMTSLRALIELQNPAMKERHWAELMEVTNVTYLLHIDYYFNFKAYPVYISGVYKKRFFWGYN